MISKNKSVKSQKAALTHRKQQEGSVRGQPGGSEWEVELFMCNCVSKCCATCQKGKNFFKVEVKIGFILALGERQIQVNNNFKSINVDTILAAEKKC